MSNPGMYMINHPWNGVIRVTWPILNFGAPMISLEQVKWESSNFIHIVCNSTVFLFENEGFLKVTGSHVRYKCVVISQKRYKMELLLLQINNRKWCIAVEYRQFRWPWVTFSVIHFLCAFSNVFLFSCSTVDKISTDIVRCAVHLR